MLDLNKLEGVLISHFVKESVKLAETNNQTAKNRPMKVTIITELQYNYVPPMCTNTQGHSGSEDVARVGENGVIEIEEFEARGEGDRWRYDIHYEDGTVIRTFNPHMVIFKTVDKNNNNATN
jgi:hypothetical protein